MQSPFSLREERDWHWRFWRLRAPGCGSGEDQREEELSQDEEDDQHAENHSKSGADTYEKAASSYGEEMSGNDRGQEKDSRDEESRALFPEKLPCGHAAALSMEHECVSDSRDYWKDYGPDRSVIQKACIFSDRHLEGE